MIKFVNKIGYTVYKITAQECMQFGGLGICDECNTFSKVGYLVPVLNHFMCPKCYSEWLSYAKFYGEDLEFQNYYIRYYEGILPVVNSNIEV